jgi:hypothetical protein
MGGHTNNGITAGFNPVAVQSARNTRILNDLMEWSLFDQGNGFAQIAAVLTPENDSTHRVIHTFCG